MARTKVQSELIATNAISGTIIADGAITSTHLAANCVDTAELVTGSIDTIHIAANQVTAAKIVSDGVETRHLHSNVISGQSAVTAASGDYVLIGDTSDSNNLKKALVSDFFVSGISSSADATAITIDSSENVGIGTGSPSDELHVKGGSTSAFIRVDNSADGHDTGFNIYQNGSRKWEIHSDDSNTDALDIRNNAGASKFTFTQDGKLGIGITSPTQTLDVRGGSGAGDHTHAIFTGTAGRGLALKSGQTGGQHNGKAILDAQDTESGGASMDFQIGGSTKVAIDNSGNLAVGNTSPSYKFEVSGTGGTRMMVENTDTNWAALDIRAGGNQSNYIFFKDDSAERARIQVLDGNDIAISTGDSPTERMRIHDEGYVVKAYQPYIRCAGNNGSMVSNQGTTADYSNWSDQVQRGITRSGAVFTVPVAGEYLITYSFYNWINNSGPGTTHAVYLQKGTTTVQEITAEYDFENDSYSYYDNNLGGSIVLNMAAGDTFKFVAYADIYGGGTHTNMSAYLLG